MAEMFYDDDADLSLIQGKNVAVIGYGSQGHAHALSLRDSGCRRPRRAAAEGSKSRAKAEAEGLRVLTPAEAVEEADVIVILAPDHVQRKLYAESIEPNITPGRHPGLRPRLQHPLRLHHPARGRRRVHGRAQGTGPPGASRVRRRPRRPRARRGREGRLRQGLGPRAVLRQGDRRPARRRHQDHLHRGDRDRPVRRAGRPLRRRQRSWCSTASRSSPRPATSPRSPTSSASTS